MKPPRLITITFSTRCNQDCIFCGLPGERSDTDLNLFDRVRGLVRPGATVDISGRGEIVLHPRFRNIVDEITFLGATASLSSNGTTLTPEVVDYLLGRSVSILNVSVNSLSEETHRVLTRRSFYSAMMHNLEYLLSRPRNFRITLSMVITGYNWTEMPALVQYGADHGVDAVRLLPLAPGFNYQDPGLQLPDHGLVEAALVEARRISDERRIPIRAPQEGKRGYSLRCRAPWSQFRVDMDGSVKTCCWSDQVLGNVQTQRWSEIWEGPLWQEFRGSVASGAMTYCQQCREFG